MDITTQSWTILKSRQKESPIAPNKKCSSVGCKNTAFVPGRCLGRNCNKCLCEGCYRESDSKFHCRMCRKTSTGGILSVSTDPATSVYYMLSVVDSEHKVAIEYLRTDKGGVSCAVSAHAKGEALYSTFVRRGDVTFMKHRAGAMDILRASTRLHMHEQLDALTDRAPLAQCFDVPKISVIGDTGSRTKKRVRKATCKIELL